MNINFNLKHITIMKRIAAIIPVLLILAGCAGRRSDLAGCWLCPIDGQEGQQGFVLSPDGSARSVNMYTLSFNSWSQEEDRLILSGESIGNGQTIRFTDTLTIMPGSDRDTLRLRPAGGGEELVFTRGEADE